MTNNEYDAVFDEAFQKAAEKMPPAYTSDHRNAWEQVQKKLGSVQRKKALQRKISAFGLISASFLLGAALFGHPAVTKAFSPIYHSMKEIPGQMIAFFFGNKDNQDTGAKTAPPQEKGSPVISSQGGTLQSTVIVPEEASRKVAFPLPSFDYIPISYTLTQTEIFLNTGEQQAKQIMYTYTNPDRQLLRVTLSKLDNNSSIGSGVSNTGEHVETVQLSGGSAYFTMAEDGTTKLEFLWKNIFVHMMGSVSKEELIKTADSMPN